MKYIDEFRDPHLARALIAEIHREVKRPLRLMEFCGGHTHAILRFGIRALLPESLVMSSGPGCPVCVTSCGDLDRAMALARIPGVILTTFGDMVKVPGSRGSLEEARAQGSDVRIVYSPKDALLLARRSPDATVIFLGVGFETTAPGVAATILEAHQQGITNFHVCSLHKLTPPAVRAILDAGEIKLSGILGPGHVTTVIGTEAWTFLSEEYHVPMAVTGFEPLDILRGVRMLALQAGENVARVDNAYSRSVLPRGNPNALAIMDRVFERCDAEWRGLGMISRSGLRIREEYSHFDAARAFKVDVPPDGEPQGCRCGEVLRGIVLPPECSLFRGICAPDRPVGPCMVSAEGACAAHYQYGER